MLELHFASGACSFVPHAGLEAIKATLERERIKLDTYKAA